MSVRKIAGLVGAFALAAGMIGTGVSAQFTGQVSAQQNLNVGTFGCKITTDTQGATLIGSNSDTVYFDAGTIASSTASSMPLNFTVTSTGTIAVQLNIAATPLSLPFTDMLTIPSPAVVLTGVGASTTFNAGISWSELTNLDLGKSVSIAYVVNCNEVGANPQTTVAFSAVMGSPYMNDTITGAGFLLNAPLTVLMYRFGSPTPYNLLGAISTDGLGKILYNFQDDCHPTPGNGAATKVDMPVVVWASDGTRSAIGKGIIPCSTFI